MDHNINLEALQKAAALLDLTDAMALVFLETYLDKAAEVEAE